MLPEITRDGLVSALRRLSEQRIEQELREKLDRKPTSEEIHALQASRQNWKLTPYRGRKTFAIWMEDARIPRARREIYRGHGKRDIGDVYERYEVSDYLREDAERMRSLLGPRRMSLVG